MVAGAQQKPRQRTGHADTRPGQPAGPPRPGESSGVEAQNRPQSTQLTMPPGAEAGPAEFLETVGFLA